MSTIGEHSGRILPVEGEGYKPISGLAIAAFVASIVGAIAVTGMFIASRLSGKPTYQPLLLLPALIGLALAIAARWQIRSSDGTRLGIRFANAAIWIAVVFGVSYLTHIVVIELAIRNQARQFTEAWVKKVATGPIETAFLDVLLPAQRNSFQPNDIDKIRQRFGSEMHPFRINEIVRMLQRAGKNYELTPRGLKEWDLMDGGLAVKQLFDLRTPEGKYELILPVYGRDIPELGGRQWLLQLKGADIKDRQTTSLGRLILDVQVESHLFLYQWVDEINRGKLFDAFLKTLPVADRAKFKDRNDAPEFTQFKNGGIVLQDGQPLDETARKKAAEEIFRPNGINVAPGSATNPVGPPTVDLSTDKVRLLHLVEINDPSTVIPITAYITTELQGDEIVNNFRELQARDWKQNPILPPVNENSAREADRFPNRTFRIVDINLRPSEPRLANPGAPRN